MRYRTRLVLLVTGLLASAIIIIIIAVLLARNRRNALLASAESSGEMVALNRYLNEMAGIALKHGATLDKNVGDAILAFFGDPETKGVAEDAKACLAMALEMQDRIATLGEIDTGSKPGAA